MAKKETYTIFEYNPQGQRLRLMTNETLMYDFKTKEFCINQNPMGEEKLVPIFDVKIADDFAEISFSTIYRKQEKKIVMNCRNKADIIMYKFFSTLHKHNFDVQKDELDRITIIINNNEIDEICSYKKDENYELLDALTVMTRNNELCFETFDPEYVSVKISSIEFVQNKFLITTETGIEEYIVDCQSTILEFIGNLTDNLKK